MRLHKPHHEIELKLQVPETALRRLGALPLLKSRKRAVTVALCSVYFDTPDLDLRRRGAELRLRRNGRRWLQTVKSGEIVLAGLHSRLESESIVTGSVPDCAAISDPSIMDLLASSQMRARLKPVFVTEFKRATRIVSPKPGFVVDVSIDHGEIKSGDRVEAICEIELELNSGSPSQLFEFALALLEHVPLSVENRSKAERGYALYRSERPAPSRFEAVALAPDMSVHEAFNAIVRGALGHLQANDRGMSEVVHPDYLHQMRVALRRLRAIFGVFSGVLSQPLATRFKADLKWLAGKLGPARDWDVFISGTLAPIRDEFGGHAGMAKLEQLSVQHRLGARRSALRAVHSKRYQRLVLSLGASLTADAWTAGLDGGAIAATSASVRRFADAALSRRAAQVAKRGRDLSKATESDLHRLRLSIKKLRYTADYFGTVYKAKHVRDTTALLARLQDILGTINDIETATGLIRQTFRAQKGKAAVEARGIMLGWNKGRRTALKHDMRAAWKAYHACKPFW